MTAWQLVLAGTGATVGLAVLFAAAVAGLGRVLDRSRDWRLDQRANRKDTL